MMNLKIIKSFWRRKADTKESEGVSGDNSSKPQQAAWQDPQHSWQRQITAFESKQAALHYIHNILESRRPIAHDVVGTFADGDHSPVFPCPLSSSWRSPPLSKDEFLAVRQDRDEMLGLLDFCLLVIPDDIPTETTVDGPATDCFTKKQWRQLLLRIVSVLIEIDRSIYTEAFVRPHHTREVPTPTESSPLTSSRLSIRSTLTPLSADIAAPCGQSAAPVTPILKANTRRSTGTPEVHHPMCALVHISRGPDEEFSLLCSLITWVTLRAILWKQLNVQRPQVDVARSISSLNSDVGFHTHDQGTEALLPGAALAFAVPWDDVVTELTEMLGVLPRRMVEALISLWILHDPGRELIRCVVQQPLRPNGDERDTAKQKANACPVTIACAAASSSGTAATSAVSTAATTLAVSSGATRVMSNTMHTTGNVVVAPTSASPVASACTGALKTSEGTKTNDFPLHPAPTTQSTTTSTTSASPTMPVLATKRPLVVDDLVEQVECLYEHNVLQAWVTYVDNSIPMVFDRGHDDVASYDVCHCNRMAAFAVASPYWAEEKRQRIFQQLCEVCNETYQSLTSVDVHRTGSLNAFSGTHAAATATARTTTTKVEASESHAPSALLENQTDPLHTTDSGLTQPTRERQSRTEAEDSTFRYASVQSLSESLSDQLDAARGALDDEDVLPVMIQHAWAAALHTRVAQCVQLAQSHHPCELFPASLWAEEAERLALEERNVAAAGGTHTVRQRALESLFYARLCTGASGGGGGDALRTAETHFANAMRDWVETRQGMANAIAYLESIALLARAQAACGADEAVAETVQIAASQVTVCEQALAHIAPPPIGVSSTLVTENASTINKDKDRDGNQVHGGASGATLLVRQAEARRRILQTKCAILREGWRAHYRLGDTAGAARFFEDYLEQIKGLRRSQREAEAYAALRERGEQLEHERCYGNAVVVLKQAVECVKNATASIPHSNSSDTVANVGTNVYAAISGNVHDALPASTATGTGSASPVSLRNELGVGLSPYLAELASPDTQPMATDRNNHVLDWVRCEVESERNLALLYVLQAEHEVNVRQRRQQLSNAVNNAYAAQNALQRWTAKVQPPIGETLLDVAANLVARAKALLRLGQPKKAALLLEPLIEEKANSASVRPPRWTNAMEHITSPMTVTEVTTCIQTLLVRITTYDVHTQCLSRFDGERACREISRAREFAHQVQAWAEGLLAELGSQGTAARSLRQCLCATFALQRALTMACGDALVILSRWEDALQEYSNALASFADGGNAEKTCCETPADQERVRGDCRMGESLVLAKLAEVYMALDKPKTAIHYYNQVLEYASEIADALLEYNARVHLARLYTATGLTEDGAAQWSKVSALAKEYEDQETSRETMRCIVTAQCAAGMYQGAIKTAEELDVLASAAEGVDAAADRRFALEALADAQLQLGQYRKCISALDEREKVQDKEGALPGVLFSMRARALIGDGATLEAIKVLTKWATEAKARGSWIEVGHANAALGFAYATSLHVFRAKRHHQIVLDTFADVGEMSKECRHAVLESARWLVNDYYLNVEEVQICPIKPLAPAAGSTASGSTAALQNSTCPVSSSSSPPIEGASPSPGGGGSSHSSAAGGGGVGNSSSGGTSGTRALKKSSPLGNTQGGNSALDEYQVCSSSGDLSVLMRYEEQRLRAARRGCSAEKESSGSEEAVSNGSDEEHNHHDDDDNEEVSGAMGFTNGSFFDMENIDISDDNGETCPMDTEKQTTKNPSEELTSPRVSWGSSPLENDFGLLHPQQQQQQPAKTNSTLANVYICNRLGAIESDNSSDLCPLAEVTESKQQEPLKNNEASEEVRDESTVRKRTKVQTLCYHRALETMEAAAHVTMMPLAMRQRLIPRSPADAVDLALLTFPRCTFVFYFAEFALHYSVVVRPAGRSFFLTRSLPVYTLENFHSVRSTSNSPENEPPQQQSAVCPLDSVTESAPLENRLSALASSLNSIRGRSHGTSTDNSTGVAVSGASVNSTHSAAQETSEWNAAAGELQESLRDLHADLWAPVRDSLRSAGCSTDESECLVLVVDPLLLHVPFPALADASCGDALPLGQQTTLIVTPTVAHFLHATRRAGGPSPFDGSAELRSAFLTENPLLGAEATAGSAWLSEPARPWTVYGGCTRKEMISAFSSPRCRALMVLCDPVGHMFKVADGMVRLGDLTRDCPCLAETLGLVVVTNERLNKPSVDEPGVAARLCLEHGCTRVLRVDLPHGTGITAAHQQVISLFMEKLELVLNSRMRFPYALALRLAQEEAQRCGMNTAVWASLTLLGGP